MTQCLDGIRSCLDGFVPAIMATLDEEGMPNVAMISQVHYVDPHHVALSYQFFNKTRRNLLATRMASVQICDPVTCERYRLDLDYVSTETHGPIFEAMKAKLAGVASHSGMQGVFHLLGSDVFRVRSIVALSGPSLSRPAARPLMPAVCRVVERMSRAAELSALFDTAIAAMTEELGIEHAILMLLDEAEERLYTVAAAGYAESGIGSEIALGDGVIGVAAQEKVPIRIGNMTTEYSYGDAVKERARQSGVSIIATREIRYPGLDAPQSQLALPVRCGNRVFGVLFVESTEVMRFGYEDEDALLLVAYQLGAMMQALRTEDWGSKPQGCTECGPEPLSDEVLAVRRYELDNSIFLDHEYLIKGVAGAILWKLLSEHVATGRTEFTNRELRLDPSLRLPEHSENLEARLILLTRRLKERTERIRLERVGRGRIRLEPTCRLALESVGSLDRVSVA